MPTMTDYQAAIGAGVTTANLVTGKMHETLRRASMVRVGIVGSAVGITAQVTIGDRTVLDGLPVSAANRFPIFPDDVVLEEAGLPLEKVAIKLTNTTAGALNAWWKVDIVEM